MSGLEGQAMATTGELGNIRGAAVDEFLAWYAAEQDLDRLTAVVRATPPELQEKVRWERGRPRLIPFAWYPCELVHAIFDGLVRDLDPASRERLGQQVATHVMRTTLHGVYKAMFKAIASPALFAKVSPRLWRLYYDTGDSSVLVEDERRHRSILAGWKGHHEFLCDINRYCGDWIYSALGCENVVSIREQCVGHGDGACVVVTTWA